MKTIIHKVPRQRLFIVLLLSAAAISEAGEKIESGTIKERTTSVHREVLAFTERPAEVEATFLVGPPEIVIDRAVAEKLGGSGIGELVRAPIENLLLNSGRFRVSTKAGPYHIRATLSNFSLTQSADKKKNAWGKAFKDVLARSARIDPNDPLHAALDTVLDADLSREESEMTLQCAVTLQLRDRDGLLIAGATGEVLRKDITRNVKAEIAGFHYSNNTIPSATIPPATADKSPAQNLQFQTRVIERAAFEALRQLIPALDSVLAKGLPDAIPTAPAATAESGEMAIDSQASGVESSAIGKLSFCTRCGQKAGSDDNFCAGCGNKLVRKLASNPSR